VAKILRNRPTGFAARIVSTASLAAVAALALAAASRAAAQERLFDAASPLEIADQGAFSVPGRYVDVGTDTIMVGQMFVQYQVPKNRTRPYPVVMIHGGSQTGINFLTTPDGRRGWADDFVAHGYAVYVVDQSGRGRSGFFTDVYGKTRKSRVANATQRFTSPETAKLWPQAERHTQWPGQGTRRDPVFDEFFATQVETIDDELMIERLNRAAVAGLLDRIGPAVLLVHSQAGVIGWTAADERPQLVRGILAIEPSGPPIRENVARGRPDFFGDGAVTRPFGVTRGPITYDPPIKDASELKLVRQEKADAPDLVRSFEQAAPARRLPRLAGIPILILAAEASYHAPYDHCTAKWLAQAGVSNEFIRLVDRGIGGNGHMMMLEKNNLQISAFLRRWESEHVH
jgi:pimeloyl-ACP methyl ester carboxylesterase